MHAVPSLATNDASAETAELDDWLARVTEGFRDTKERRESLVLLKAIRLAPSLEICEMLLRGEQVPVSKLDQRSAKAYGLIT